MGLLNLSVPFSGSPSGDGGGSASSGVTVRNYFAGFIPLGGIEAVPSTLPTLTWDFGSDQALTSPTSPSDFHSALKAAVEASASGWRVTDHPSLNGSWNGGQDLGTIICGPTGSPVENLRVVTTTSAQLDNAASGNNALNTNPASLSCPRITMSPDAGAAGGNAFETFGPAADQVSDGGFINGGGEAAFLGTERETGFQCFHDRITATGMDNVYVWDNNEMLMILTERSNTIRVALTGATIVPLCDDAAEADGRVYGLHTTGMNGGGHSNANTFPSHYTTTSADKGIVFDPNSPSSTLVLRKPQIGVNSLGTSTKGPQAAASLQLNNINTPYNLFGWLRQIGAFTDMAHGTPITNKDGLAVGLALARSPSASNNDTFAVTNVGNQGTPSE